MSIEDDHTRLSDGAVTPAALSNSEHATVLSPFSGSGSVPSNRPELVDGQPFGPYRIVRLLGRGGMGEVYEAEHLETGRHVALKLLRGQIDRLEDRERFLREGQMAASVSDPHTVYVFGSEEIDGMSAISMQLLPGGTLKDRVTEHGPQPVSEAVSAVVDVISGLDAALAAGILHRDIKPSNCFVDSDGSVKVGDFGLSIPAERRSADRTFMGTPQYASPEQLRGDALDVRSDIYAVGATLHYLLTGAAPFEGSDFTTLIDRVKHEPPPMAHKIRSGVPAALGTLIARCLAKDPADRPASYQDLARALRPFFVSGSPARLDVRLLAGVVDYLLIAIPAGILNSSFGPPSVQRGNVSAEIDPFSFVVGVLYFALCEGIWSRTLGKRLLGLRVLSGTGALSWRQAAGRALIYYVPALTMVIPMLAMGARPLAEYLVAHPGVSASAAFVQAALMLLLFSTMRRKNGYAAVHDLLTKTRVVKSVSRELRRREVGDAVGVAPDTGRSDSTQRRLGPFIVGRELAVLGEARLFEGLDPILRRSVWLVEWSDDAKETPKTRRDVARVGRLHWLAGRRAPGDRWDAFEAPQGARLPTGGAGTAWPVVHGWLKDLATELAAAERDGTTPPLGLDRVWIRPDGRAVLLDWPAPGTEAPADPATAQQFLAAVGQCASEPVPASAVAMLDRWRKKRAVPLVELIGDLALVTASSGAVTRSRRAGPLLLAASPVILMLVIAVVANSLSVFLPHDRFVANELLEDLTDEREPDRQKALQVYLAGALRAELVAADAPWQSAEADDPGDKDAIALRNLAAATAALTPSQPEVAQAATVLAPELQRAERRFLAQDNETTVFVALLLVGAAMSLGGGLVSVLARPSGFVLSSLGLAVITKGGREVGRVRAVLRLIVAWLPLLIYGAFLAWPVTRGAVLSIAVASLAAAPTAIGFVWSVLHPTRGPHDMIAGTSIGAR